MRLILAFLHLFNEPGDIKNGSDLYWFQILGKWKCELFSHVWLFATPWNVAHQALLSMEFSRQEYWSGWPYLLQRIFLSWRENPGLLHYRQIIYHLSHHGSPIHYTLHKANKSVWVTALSIIKTLLLNPPIALSFGEHILVPFPHSLCIYSVNI